MEQGDFDLLKDIPGFKAILRAVLKSQMKHLVEQLSKHGEEEAMLLTTSIVDGSFYQLGSAGAEGFLENRDEIKSQFLGYCLKNVHQQQTEQSHEVEKTVERTKDKTGLNISPGSSKSKKLVSAARKQSESTVLPVSLARVEERTLSETDTYQTGPNAGRSDLNKKKGRGRRKRASETIISEKQVKRAALAETVTYPAQTVQASVESSQGITVVTSDSVQVKEDVDAEGAKAIHPKDAFNILPLHAEAEGAKVMHPKDAFNILPRHTQSESSENKDDTDTRESNGSELEEPDQSMDNIESEGALTGIKVEPADQEEIADVEDSTSQLQLDYSATAAEGEEGAHDSSVQQSGNFKAPTSRRSYPANVKLEIVKYSEMFGIWATERQFGVSEASIRLWRKTKDKLSSLENPNKRKCRNGGPKYGELEDVMRNFVSEEMAAGTVLTDAMIRRKAVEVAGQLNIEGFLGSAGWLAKFRQRTGFH